MRPIEKNKLRLSDQSGSTAILAAFGISAAIASGVYVVSDKIAQVEKHEKRLESSSQLTSLNLESLEQVAQLIQTNVLEINTDHSSIGPDSIALKPISDGGYGWSYVDGRKDQVSYSYCRTDLSNSSVQSIVDNSRSNQSCSPDRKVVTNIAIERIQLVDINNVDGSTTETAYAVLSSTTSLYLQNEKIQRVQKARIQIPRPGDGDCPFTDPNMNPPKKPSRFTAPMYVAVDRAFVGWTKIGFPVDQPRAGGYASVDFDREIFSDERCGSHVCNYWAPSTSTEDIRAWRVQLGGLIFGVQLHTPKDAPGSCYVTFHPNRRPRSSWNNGCFAPGTMIRMADQSTKPVEKLEKGDLIYNPITRSALKIDRTIAGPENEPLLKISTSHAAVTVTTKHPFETKNGLKAAKDLSTSDFILSHGGRFDKVQQIQVIDMEPNTFVYNFALENQGQGNYQHMVEADGVVTGDLYLQEKVSGVDPTKRPMDPEIGPYKGLITSLMTKSE